MYNICKKICKYILLDDDIESQISQKYFILQILDNHFICNNCKKKIYNNEIFRLNDESYCSIKCRNINLKTTYWLSKN